MSNQATRVDVSLIGFIGLAADFERIAELEAAMAPHPTTEKPHLPKDHAQEARLRACGVHMSRDAANIGALTASLASAREAEVPSHRLENLVLTQGRVVHRRTIEGREW